MAILGLDHVNIRTTDLARTRAFFTEVLGLTVGWRPDFSFGGAWLYAGGRDVVHLVEVTRAGGASKGSSLDHFAFAIDDYDDARHRLEAAGIAYEAGASPNGGIRQVFVTELNGVTFELNCREPAPTP
ncbi:MAG TPA: VOC family protein [Phenylobacterium sp.]|uniref:VOC family protein n=1 Tax=Phenylobacterium sp. TaxID=1871053 RepID=UPI002C400097|nr:VOC family protein [Phenylobacterium sp.]HXA40169.1 VOC family protein [Phenylobacterium sp.]